MSWVAIEQVVNLAICVCSCGSAAILLNVVNWAHGFEQVRRSGNGKWCWRIKSGIWVLGYQIWECEWTFFFFFLKSTIWESVTFLKAIMWRMMRFLVCTSWWVVNIIFFRAVFLPFLLSLLILIVKVKSYLVTCVEDERIHLWTCFLV